MKNLVKETRYYSPWNSRLFIIAGCFLLINTAFLWIRFYSNHELSILWAATPAIVALSFSVFGLFKLYPRAAVYAPLTAKIGAGFALLACASLGATALWIFAVSVFGEGMPQPVPQGLLMLITLFIISMLLAYLSSAIAFLLFGTQQKIGYLLTVPVSMWAIMLLVSILKSMEVGLSLDYYTNPVIAATFLRLGFILKPSSTTDSKTFI